MPAPSEDQGRRRIRWPVVFAKRYLLLRRIDVETRSATTAPVFDQLAAFFVPVAGFASFERPGPTIEIYERVDQ